MLTKLLVKWKSQHKFLAVLKHLQFPFGAPLLEDILADLRYATINTHFETVLAVAGDRPHRHY